MKSLNFLRSQSGFGLIEAIIGVVLVAVVALLVAQFTSKPLTSKSASHARTCEALARSTIDVIKKRGIYHDIYNYFPLGTSRNAGALFNHLPYVPNTSLWGAQFGDGANEFRINQLIPNSYTSAADDLEESRAGYALIDSSMRSLTGIYNRNPPGSCVFDSDTSTWTYIYRYYAPLSAVNQGHVSDLVLDGPRPLLIKIMPYRLSTGDPLNTCPSIPQILRPLPPPIPNRNAFESTGAATPNNEDVTLDGFDMNTFDVYNASENEMAITTVGTAFAASFPGTIAASDRDNNMGNRGVPILRKPGPVVPPGTPNDQTDIGFKFDVEISYLYDGVRHRCAAEQRFQYFMDQTKPPQPQITLVNNTVPNYDPLPPFPPDPDGVDYALAGASHITNNRWVIVRVLYSGTENGIQLMCRDRSRRFTWQHPDPIAGVTGRGVPCVLYNPADPPYDPLAVPYTYPPSINVANTTGIPEPARSDLPGVAMVGGSVREWVPCEQVRACGVNPTNATLLNPNPRVKPNGYEMFYNLNPTLHGCDVTIDAIAIDAAGNRSDLETTLATSQLVRSKFSMENKPASSLIRRPRCGRSPLTTTSYFGPPANLVGLETEFGFYCSETVPGMTNWSGALSTAPAINPLDPLTKTWNTYYPNGYFTTSPAGCCVGANCGPQTCNAGANCYFP